MARKFISPSRLSRFYFHECERFLRFSSVATADRAVEGVPAPPYDPRPVTRAILETGAQWEEEVIERLLAGRAHVADGNGSLSDRFLDQAAAQELLSTIGPGEFVYQPELAVPASFYEAYAQDPDVVTWTACRPDLIECVENETGQLELRVIDIKASPGVKLSHRVQATVYSMVLEQLVIEWGLADRTVGGLGGIWLAQQDEPEYFELRTLRPPIEQFLTVDLLPLLEQPAAAAPWHLYFRCEWCEWFDHCRGEMRDTDSVSRLPYLTSHAKRFLASSAPPVETLSEFGALLGDPDRRAELDRCASLSGKSARLTEQVGALTADEVRPFAGSSLAMPVLEHVRIVLTAQSEPVSGQLYAFGIYAQGIKQILGENKTIVKVAAGGDPETVADLRRSFVLELWEIFDAVDAYNRDHDEWKDKKSLQVFTFDSYESRLIVEALLEMLGDPQVAEVALKVLFQMQGPDLLQAEEHPSSEVFFPIVVLNDVLRDRLALPIEVSYRFADAVALLQPEKYGFEFNDSEYFAFALSNQMRSDAIYAVWYDGHTDRMEWIEKEVRTRLWATNSLVNGMRETLSEAGALFAYPPKFQLPRSFDYQSPLLSRLAFLAQYESVIRYLELRTARMGALPERIRSGQATVVRLLGGSQFAVNSISEDLEFGGDPFPSWILIEASAEGQRDLLGFDDYWNRSRVWVRKGLKLRLAGVQASQGSPVEQVELALTEGPDSPELKEDVDYLLCPRFTDFLTSRAVEELRDIDDEDPEESGFLELLQDPVSFSTTSDAPADERDDAMALAEQHGMTASQLEAFDGMLTRRLQLVWGPPGTGKTHFLALAILCLAEVRRTSGLPLRAMLTGFTHAAIENALRKVSALQSELKVVNGGIAIGKLQTLNDADLEAQLVDRDAGDAWLADHELAVLGGTVWALRRTAPRSADVVVVDESSQVLVPSSAIAVRRLAGSGRLVMAGDDRQLPPIVAGTYPEPGEDEPLLHRSIFESLRRREEAPTYTSTLLENWRMNESLCAYPREQIYVPGYASATDEIAGRTVALVADAAGAWYDDLIDPEYPLVVCVIRGVQATAENLIEAELVAEVTMALRGRMLDQAGNTYTDDEAGDAAFWTRGMFVVSPHHAQIRAIQRALDDRREWLSTPFVDTVDKMQGQECDAVIVSYGVSDVEYALSEMEFIYSMNRLNVSITRARSKTIVFLPQPLLDPPVTAFDDETVAEGIAFMQGLRAFAQSAGESIERPLADGADLSIYRVPA